MDSSQPPLRTACARCHAQKLRCSGRSDTAQACSRCIKAGAACVFGASVRGKRPAAVAAQGLRTASEMDKDFPAAKRTHRTLQTETPSEMSEQTSPSIAAEWNAALNDVTLDDATLNGAEIAEQLSLAMGNSAPTITDIDSTAVTDAHIQVVEHLTALNVDLLRHAKTIPPLNGLPPDITRDHESFKLDDIFKLTVAFRDVVQSLQVQGDPDMHTPGWRVAVDMATLFLVMSCWRRLTDMYDCIFIHMHRCAEQSVLPATRGGKPVSLPLLSIGSFVPDATTSILLQMVATLQHSTQLANDMSDFAAKVSLEGSVIHSDELAYTDLQRRTNNLHQQVRSVKSLLAQTGLF
ncbi:hypothetical protein GGR52DRAFT_582081 [Hypoxylon sp. FL1284]|nr:hypothetical protein GGR52DRAFT_582081 [Hypoxylon sp. FL1284]